MLKSTYFKRIELAVLFVLIPILLTLNWSIRGRIGIAILGFVYVLILMFTIERPHFKKVSRKVIGQFIRVTLVKFVFIAIGLVAFMYVTNPDKLFYVVLERPKVWLFFIGVYTVFSVIPQEILYRTFFFQRYGALFKNTKLLIFFNALIFSLGHLFFANTLVMIITFIGGLLFALTYQKTKSTLLVIVEHTIYGCWLYTVGMGQILGFPA